MKPEHTKLLVFDIETKPMKVYTWRIGSKISIGHNMICQGEGWDIICICWRWVHEKKVHSLDWGIKKQDSTQMLKEFSEVYNSADIVIGQNSDKFDIKHINSQLLLKKLPPLNMVPTEDTLKQARSAFVFPSFKLDYMANLLLGSSKDEMKFQDWIDIVEHKDEKALKKMIKYCAKDVSLTADYYQIISPYVKHVVNKSILVEGGSRDGCPACGSMNRRNKGLSAKNWVSIKGGSARIVTTPGQRAVNTKRRRLKMTNLREGLDKMGAILATRECPECKSSWVGEPIPKEHQYEGGGTHYGREIGVEDMWLYDGISWWMCPDCEARWNRWTGELVENEDVKPASKET